MLSFKRGKNIALIKYDGKKKSKILKIDTESDFYDADILSDTDPIELINEDEINEMGGKLKSTDIARITKGLKKSKKPNKKELEEIYEKTQARFDDIKSKEIAIYEGTVTPFPNQNTRDVIYIGGPSGSGKSYLTGLYIENYKKLYPKNSVYVFSTVTEDEALDKYDVKRILIDDELIEDPISAEELQDSCVIFDDIDTISDKNLQSEIHLLRDKLLETGRHYNIYMVCTAHQLVNYNKTRALLNESTHIAFFPSSGSTYYINDMLKRYCSFSKKDIEKVHALPSRWVMIGKTYPQYVLYDKGCYLLSK